MAEKEDGPAVITRAMAILDSFDGKHRHQNLASIARRAKLPVSTTHRLVNQLLETHALVRTADGSYEIGTKLWRLGLLASVHSNLREIALPYMEDIYAIAHDAVQLGVPDGMRCLVVERIAGSRTTKVISRPGVRLPLHASGVGKVLLAFGPKEIQEAELGILASYTAKTITDTKVLQLQLKKIRQIGYAYSEEELALGVATVAVPVFGPNSRAIAALGVVTPIGNKDYERVAAVLKVTAGAMAKKLAANGITDLSQKSR
ncbi:MAG: IclR family transcriptional regulator [Micrococcales bacterium]